MSGTGGRHLIIESGECSCITEKVLALSEKLQFCENKSLRQKKWNLSYSIGQCVKEIKVEVVGNHRIPVIFSDQIILYSSKLMLAITGPRDTTQKGWISRFIIHYYSPRCTKRKSGITESWILKNYLSLAGLQFGFIFLKWLLNIRGDPREVHSRELRALRLNTSILTDFSGDGKSFPREI